MVGALVRYLIGLIHSTNASELNWVESLIFEVGDTKTVIWHWISLSSGECRQTLGPGSSWINAEMHKEQT